MKLVKKALMQRMFAFACMALAVLSACSDDDSEADPKDTDLPTVTITGVQPNTAIWNTVTVTVAAEDNDAVQKIEILVDNASVLTKTEASLSYELNTIALNLADGQHTLTVIVTDAAGNQKKEEYSFTVQNTLVSADVPGDFLTEGEKGFIFLSDATGKTITSQSYKNGDKIRLTAPAYDKGDFYLTEVIIREYENVVRTFSNVNRGAWVLTPGKDASTSRQPVAVAELSVTNALPNAEYYFLVGASYAYLNPEIMTMSIDLYIDPSPIYIGRIEDGQLTHYLLTPPVSGGIDNDEIDLSLVNNPLTHKTVDVSNYGYTLGAGSIYGLLTPGDYNTRYNVGDIFIKGKNLDYKYPGNAFPEYYSYVNLWGNNFDIVNRINGMPDYTPLPAEINVKVEDGTIKGTVTSSDADFVYTLITYPNDYTYWFIYGEKGAVDLVVPQIPADIKATIPMNDAPHISTTAFQKFSFDGYDGFLDFVRHSTNGAHRLKSLGETYKLIETFEPTPAGRKAASTRFDATHTVQ